MSIDDSDTDDWLIIYGYVTIADINSDVYSWQ
jgi:hypothetical protein